jgi:molybdate transport system substrate-binding protein
MTPMNEGAKNHRSFWNDFMGFFRVFVAVSALLASSTLASADNALIAIAANFADAAKEIETAFEADGKHQIDITTGATGKLYAQIKADAPFDALLSADQKTPKKLVDESLGVAGSAFTYGVGKLALYSADAKLLANEDGAKFLAEGTFRHLAIANPELAPYGAAGDAFLKNLFLKERIQDRLVTGENIGQTFTMVQTGAAELGFVAYSQVLKDGQAGSFWLVPHSTYPAIKQDAVLLKHGENNETAKAFLAFLKTDTALAIMKTHGYDQQ